MKYKQIKNSASPSRFTHAPYQPLCLKRRMDRAQWRGLFLDFDHHNQPRHCALDAQSIKILTHLIECNILRNGVQNET